MIEKLPLGKNIKALLESNQFYRCWKYSESGLWLWRLLAFEQSAYINKEDQLYRQLLRPLRNKTMPIFDVGANVGWLTKTFLDFSENVVAVEPDTFNQNVLRKRFGKNYRFNLVSKAVSSSEGLRELLILEEGSALNTFSSKWKKELESGYFSKRWLFSSRKQIVPTTTLDGLIAEFGLPYLAKIDVEGHELEVFKGLSQPIPLIVFEANLPVFLEETKQILEILTRLDANVLFNYSLKFEPELPNYVPSMELPKAFESMGKCTVEIIGRMSNYFEYYQPINEKN